MSYDDRKKSKLRTDKYDNKSSLSYYGKSASRNRYDEHDNRDDYYSSSNKKVKSKSRSRSRSPARSKSITAKSFNSDSYSAVTKSSVKPATTLPKFGFSGFTSLEKKFNPGPPSRTIMMRQIPLEMDDNELRNEFTMLLIPFKDIRLVKNRDTGISRGFAFIEFSTVEEAQAWMNTTQGWIMFSNYDNKIQLFYSHSSADEVNSVNSRKGSLMITDWDCSKCGIKNFKRRDKCFKCGISREDSEKRKDGEGYEFAGTSPCNTLLLRGLDALTSSDTIIKVLNEYSNYNLPVKQCHIAKDIHTNVSNGFAFVEMSSIQDAGYMIQLVGTNIELDGKQVVVNYCKHSYKTAISLLEDQFKKGYYDTPSDNSMYVYNTHVNNKVNQTDQANSAAAVAQAALQSMQKKQELLSHITNSFKLDAVQPSTGTDLDSSVNANLQYIAKQVDMISNKVYQAPDVSQFTYDETSGYYYDYTTGFYYDATSQYYFNSLTQQYMYWDPNQSTYIPVTTSATTASTANDATKPAETINAPTNSETKPIESTPDSNKTVKTSAKPKTAAQIAKDMERWAKEQANKKKETIAKKPSTTTPQNHTPQTVQAPVEIKTSGGYNQIGTPIVKPKEEEVVKPTASINESLLNKKSTIESNEIDSGSDNSNEMTANETSKKTIDESSLIDTAKMACLLCKRRFDSVDILNKHVAKSDLHKTNLEKLRKENSSTNGITVQKNENGQQEKSHEVDSLQAALQYRDRARERREKFGLPEPPSPTYSSKTKLYDDLPSTDTSTNTITYAAANTDSVASKMMRKMGWNEGSGIGKNLQGISAPIEATMRQKGSGLGASNLEIDPNDSYQVAVRKSAKARFEQLS